MAVNIVMIAKDRPRLTRQALESLVAHTDPDMYNLTLIDDGSEETIEGVGKDIVCLRIYPSKGIVGLVRNIGADFAQRYWGRGDWLCFLDNDVYLHDGWLEKMVAGLGVGRFLVIGGARHPFHQPHRGGNAYLADIDCRNPTPGSLGTVTDSMTVQSVDAVAGYSMLMSWETWDKYGPFDQHARGVCQSEDWALCQKVIKDGYNVGYISPPVLTVCGLTNTLGEKVPGYEELKKLIPEGVYWE
jgi:glycosyltransferase involved in cell wall biosynthesis